MATVNRTWNPGHQEMTLNAGSGTLSTRHPVAPNARYVRSLASDLDGLLRRVAFRSCCLFVSLTMPR